MKLKRFKNFEMLNESKKELADVTDYVTRIMRVHSPQCNNIVLVKSEPGMGLLESITNISNNKYENIILRGDNLEEIQEIKDMIENLSQEPFLVISDFDKIENSLMEEIFTIIENYDIICVLIARDITKIPDNLTERCRVFEL